MDHEDTDNRELWREHLAALDCLRHAKNLFLALALAAVACHLFAWIVFTYTDRLRPLDPITLQSDPSQTASPPWPSDQQLSDAQRWKTAIDSALNLAGFVGRGAVLILAGLFLILLLICLNARLGGASRLAACCVWTLTALAVVVPWVRTPADAVSHAASAFYTFRDLDDSFGRGQERGFIPLVRFGLCPLFVAACLVAAQISFREAYNRILKVPTARLPIHEV